MNQLFFLFLKDTITNREKQVRKLSFDKILMIHKCFHFEGTGLFYKLCVFV